MIGVSVRGELPVAHQVAACVNSCQDWYRFTVAHEDQGLVLHLCAETHHGLFRVFDERNVVVSMWQGDGLSHYANLALPELLALCALLGITQARTVQINGNLRVEDFIHRPHAACLFATLPLKQLFAEALRGLHVCPGCLEFYRCLALEPEMDALLRLIRKLEESKTTRAGT